MGISSRDRAVSTAIEINGLVKDSGKTTELWPPLGLLYMASNIKTERSRIWMGPLLHVDRVKHKNHKIQIALIVKENVYQFNLELSPEMKE